ncbi:hypothetical protein ACPV5O_02555 [Vibrio maritimus]|uniref:hypothetical protein n=1 Tax=Vibrio maritimus TaxID=990268 RepID=UPI004068C311
MHTTIDSTLRTVIESYGLPNHDLDQCNQDWFPGNWWYSTTESSISKTEENGVAHIIRIDSKVCRLFPYLTLQMVRTCVRHDGKREKVTSKVWRWALSQVGEEAFLPAFQQKITR